MGISKRLTFLLGNLCGLVVGGLLVSVYFSTQPVSGTAAPRVVSPQHFVVPANLNSADTPESWQRREFNGRPFYLIPIATLPLGG